MRLAAGVLGALPSVWFVRLRRAASSATGGRRRRVLHALVGVARHRRLPVADFALDGPEGPRLVAADSVVVSTLYWYGTRSYEGAEPDWWCRACRQATEVVELGANVGYYTVLGAWANPSCHYRAVEPHPRSADVLRANVERNRLPNVEVIEAAAVGDDRESVELAVPDQDPHRIPAGAFVRDGSEGVAHVDAARTMRVETVDARVLLRDVDLVKLDIEGHEAAVLEAVRALLVERTPTIFVEIRLAALPRLRRLLTDLGAAGYGVHVIGPDGLHEVDRSDLEAGVRLPRLGSKDLILATPERLASMQAGSPR